MITVPDKYTKSLEALLLTPTGNELVNCTSVSTVKATVKGDLKAHGQSVDKVTIHLGPAEFSVPQMACILAHELTHCHDLTFFGGSWRDYQTKGQTEVSAHFNQGIILRELKASAKVYAEHKAAIDAAVNGSTVFGISVGWKTRDDVIRFLSDKPQYKALLGDPSNTGIALWDKSMWSFGSRFHCDENWDKYTKRPGASKSVA
ncbi:MAG: hypothetical protein ACI835_003196 [Planctomycetota bacterium]|jgi:hypothetical protein